MATFLYTRADGTQAVLVADATETESHGKTAVLTKHPLDSGATIADHHRVDNATISLTLVFSNKPTHAKTDDFFDGAVGGISNLVLDTSRTITRVQPGGPLLSNPGRPPQTLRDVAGGGTQLINLIPPGGPIPKGLPLSLASTARIEGVRPEFTPRPSKADAVKSQGASVLQWDREFDRVAAVYTELLALIENHTALRIETSLRTYENMVLTGVNPTRDAATGNVLQVTIDAEQAKFVTSEKVQITQPLQARGALRKNKGTQATKEPTTKEEEKTSLSYNFLRSQGLLPSQIAQ